TLAADGQRLGLEFIPVKQRSLAAARGTTPFDALFLSLSFFIIAAALILVLLLYRLGVEQRASEIGVLLATGWTTRRVARVLAAEGALVASIGGVVGVALGLGYAWLMLTGLRTWWLGAVAVPFLELHVSLTSLIVGAASGVLVSTGVIALSLRQLARVPIRPLLGGRFETVETMEAVKTAATGKTPHGGQQSPGWWSRVRSKLSPTGIAIGCIVGAVIALAVGPSLSGEAQAGAFVGAGAMLLTAMLAYCWRVVTTSTKPAPKQVNQPKLGLARLAWRNASRNPGRTVMTIGLLASACFLIISMSAFRLAPTSAGTGGFALLGESSQPLLADLNADDTRAEWDAKTRRLLEGTRIYGLRLKPGDDASCSNLYQATQPRVLGVPRDFVERFSASAVGGFSWAGVAAKSEADRANPWRLLEVANAEGPVPVVLDKNTALYSLHLYGGVGQEFDIEYEGGVKVRFRVAGLLGGSVLQGSLLIAESEFKRLFPDISGHRAFLVATPADGAAASKIGETLEELFGDQGLDLTSTERLLSDYLAVQNTYLSTFQSLGALGLLLGTFGLAAAQLRSVLERRGELALMRATGFRRGRLAQLVLLEHSLLLSVGLGIGLAAALGAIGPLMAGGGMQGARASLGELATWVALIFVVGLAAGGGAVRATMRAPVIGALRGD
ncbi:MAG TPA: ABC transporter permease, partial [Pirellulaceae bacterium]|nr:ABC transporter permease [Pirellulaceae bacterium]